MLLTVCFISLIYFARTYKIFLKTPPIRLHSIIIMIIMIIASIIIINE